MKTRWTFVFALLIGGVGMVACGDDDDDAADNGSGNGDSGGAGVDYVIESNEFSDLTASAGATIEISNESGAAHTFTADDGAFDEDIEGDGSVTVTAPDAPGDYPFHCNIHSSMTATLTVE